MCNKTPAANLKRGQGWFHGGNICKHPVIFKFVVFGNVGFMTSSKFTYVYGVFPCVCDHQVRFLQGDSKCRVQCPPCRIPISLDVSIDSVSGSVNTSSLSWLAMCCSICILDFLVKPHIGQLNLSFCLPCVCQASVLSATTSSSLSSLPFVFCSLSKIYLI